MNNYIPKDGDIVQVGNNGRTYFSKLVLTINSRGFRFGGPDGDDLRGGDGQCRYCDSFPNLVAKHFSWCFFRVFPQDGGPVVYFKGTPPPPVRKRVVRD